jgi:transposase
MTASSDWICRRRVHGSQHKAPFGGEGTGPNPVDRGKCSWKWSLATDRNGIPVGWEIAGANRNDCILLHPMLDGLDGRGLLAEVETLHLDRGYDHDAIRCRVADWGIDDLVCAKRRPNRTTRRRSIKPIPLGLRWPIERTNSWLSNFGQLRRNTDRFIHQRLAQFALAIACIITIKLIKWADRYNPTV